MECELPKKTKGMRISQVTNRKVSGDKSNEIVHYIRWQMRTRDLLQNQNGKK